VKFEVKLKSEKDWVITKESIVPSSGYIVESGKHKPDISGSKDSNIKMEQLLDLPRDLYRCNTLYQRKDAI
jgi:hypothetical protein